MNLGELVSEVQGLTQAAGVAYNRGQSVVSETKLRDLRDLLNAEVEDTDEAKAETAAETTEAERAATEAIEDQAETEAESESQDGSSHPEEKPSEE